MINSTVRGGEPSISVYLNSAVEAAARSQDYAATTPAQVAIGAVVLLGVLGMFAAVAHRSIVGLVQRLTRPAAAAARRAFAEPVIGGTGRAAGRAPARPAADITSIDDLRDVAAAFNTTTAQLCARAREQRRIRDMIAAERDLADSVLKVAGSLILVLVLDRDGRIVEFNRACEATTGYRSSDVQGRTVSELFLLPEEVEYAAPSFGEPAASAPDSSLPSSFVCTWIGRDNRRHQIAWSNATVIDRRTGSPYVVATGIDVTDRRAAETELREAQERFRLAFENAPIGMCLISLDGRFMQVNPALGEMLGRSETELVDLSVAEVAHPGDVQTALRAIANLRTGQTHAWHDEIRYLRTDGRVVWGLMSVSVVHRDNGEPFYYLTQVQDITARRLAEERLAQQALHDPLTGLPNRVLLMQLMQHELSRRRHGDNATGLLCADLDAFKRINETLGHYGGDQVLREVARRLQSGIRSTDTVARFGSDEFAILCSDVPDRTYLVGMAKRLADSVSVPIVVEGREIVVSTSIGIAVNQADDPDADRLVRNANIALYQAKAGGPSGCRLFEDSLSQPFIDRSRIEEGLRQGLRDGHFVLHFQPVVDVPTRRVVAVEALLRLNHPELGLLMPSTFVGIAEESGLIAPIGTWVLQEACRQLASWRSDDRAYEGLRIAVNVSARQVARPDLVDAVARALAESHLPPQSLGLELTESALMEADAGAARVLQRIRDMGVGIGIDDFGTGYSSLLYLKLLPVSFIKIDQSFVSGVVRNSTDRKIVTAIIRLGRALGLPTIAEGVESPEQLAALQDLGCDLAQGYLFGPPRPGPPDHAPAVNELV